MVSTTKDLLLSNKALKISLSVHLGLTTCTDWELGAKDRFYHWSMVMFKCHFRCLEGPSSKWMILTIFGYGVMSSLAAQRFFGWRSTRMRPSVLSNCVAFVRLGSGE